MQEYALYVESGPKKKKTMVHVLDLLGLVVRGTTTEQALANVPDAIKTYLVFLHSGCKEAVEPSAPFTTRIAEHVMSGNWLAEGDPTGGFAPDFLPLSVTQLIIYLARLDAIHASLLQEVAGLSAEEFAAEPADGHRSLRRIFEHAADSEYNYLRMLIGADKDIQVALKFALHGPIDMRATLPAYWEKLHSRLAVLTPADLGQFVPHGQTVWSAHRTLRRMLEHSWEHREEIRFRLESTVQGP